MLQRTLIQGLMVALLGTSLIGLTSCKAPPFPECKKDKHCAEVEGTCVEGLCQNCKSDDECKAKGPNGEDWSCKEFLCTEAAAGDSAGGNGACTQRYDCEGGMACKAGSCAACNDDMDCAPSTCNLETGRCAAEGGCEVDEHCAQDEICDGGMCVFSGAPVGEGAVCGLDAVYFGFDSDTISPKATEELTALATCLVSEGGKVMLEAHADSVGTEEYNILLTQKRGQAVMNFLVEKGVAAENLRVVGKGSLEATATTESEMAKERKVKFFKE